MKTTNHWLAGLVLAGGIITGVTFCAHAQPDSPPPDNRGGRGPDWQNLDAQQIQQFMQRRMMEAFRERLEVTDDAEWGIIESRLSKVTQARLATMSDGAGLMGFGGMAFGRGGPGRGGDGPGRGLQGMFGQPSPEAQELQKAIDAKAPSAEIKTKLSRLQAARKEKQAQLAKAQEELRQVLTPRQEAVATLMGALD